MARGLGLVAILLLAACGGTSGQLTGEELAADLGCVPCHGDEDTNVGPTLAGLWGTEVLLEDGRSVIADEAYVRRAITDPDSDVVPGYESSMPRYGLTDEELDVLVEYVRSLE
ncbi:MAG: cytochrome c [Acidimicrobiia bacterium]|jgi:cytochrome c oxidase subunit 2